MKSSTSRCRIHITIVLTTNNKAITRHFNHNKQAYPRDIIGDGYHKHCIMLVIDIVFVALVLLAASKPDSMGRNSGLSRSLAIYDYVTFLSWLLFVSSYLYLRLGIS